MYMYALTRAKLLQLCPTLCDPKDCSPPGSSVHGILQARILQWVAISFSRGSFLPRDQTHEPLLLQWQVDFLPLNHQGRPKHLVFKYLLCKHLVFTWCLRVFVVIHTVKGFGTVNKAEIDVSPELSCFFHDPADAGNLISGSSAFSKTSLNIWNVMVHILLKPGLENFEHYLLACEMSAIVW